MSDPKARGRKPAATAAPEPLEEPPGKYFLFQALRAGGQGKSKEGPPNANSWVESLPKSIAPASLSFPVTKASLSATLSFNRAECAVVFHPFASIMSFNPKGIPCKGPNASPFMTPSSAILASFKACSGLKLINVLKCLSYLSIRFISASVSSTGESFLVFISLTASRALNQCNSVMI